MTPLSSFGDVWLDPQATFPIAMGVQNGAGQQDMQRAVPNSLGLTGLALSYQAVAGSVPILTNATSVVLSRN